MKIVKQLRNVLCQTEQYKSEISWTVISPEAEPPHAFNVVVLNVGGDIEARLWEPQSDKFVTTKEDMYTLDGALIRI